MRAMTRNKKESIAYIDILRTLCNFRIEYQSGETTSRDPYLAIF